MLALRGARRAARAHRDPGQRRRDDGSQLRRVPARRRSSTASRSIPSSRRSGTSTSTWIRTENLTVHSEDARPWLRRSEGGYDAIFVDAYRQPYIPFYLATKEFFALVRDRLAPGGVVVVNAGHPEGNDDLEKVLGRTMSEVFPNVMRDPIEPTNTLLVGSEGELSADAIREGTQNLPVEVANLGAMEASRFGELLAGGEVYSDDRAPVEWLIDRSILGYAGDN